MRKKIEWIWEDLDDNTRRAKVIGGWLVNTHRRADSGKTTDQALTFVADRDHEWTILDPITHQVKVSAPKINPADFKASV